MNYHTRIYSIIIIVLCILIFLVSCGNYNNGDNEKSVNFSSDPFVAPDESNDIFMEYSIGLTNDSLNLLYEGDDVSATIEVQNGEHEVELGFMIFVDGYCVPFSLDKKTNNTMSVIQVGSNESARYTFNFSPESGKKGDLLEVQIACIAEPNYVPSFVSGDSTFGLNHSMDALRTTLVMETDAPYYDHNVKIQKTTGPVTDELRQVLLLDEDDYTVEQYEKAISNSKLPLSEQDPDISFAPNNFWGFNSFDNLNQTHIEISSQSVFEYNIIAMASEEYTYRTTLFINNEPVKTVDGYDCIETNIPLFEYALATVRYDISSYSDETIILYAVAVPTSGTEKCWTRAVKTDSLALIIG